MRVLSLRHAALPRRERAHVDPVGAELRGDAEPGRGPQREQGHATGVSRRRREGFNAHPSRERVTRAPARPRERVAEDQRPRPVFNLPSAAAAPQERVMTTPAVARAREVEVRRRSVAACGGAQRAQQQAPAPRSRLGVREHPEHGAEISSRERVRRAGSDANRDSRGRAVVRRPRGPPRRVVPFFLDSRVRAVFVARLFVSRGVREPFQQFPEQVRLVGGGAGRDGIRQQSREYVEDPRPQRRLIGAERLRGPSPASAQQRRDHR
mmetsp:Transcript_10129/g.41787  ORF Transcript_10129/g.41787 Transcript_10129/m.41787 type:complete len:266 (+) Transcript_10129:604-1401(+)